MSHPNILTEPAQLRELLRTSRRVAVLGIKTEAQAEQPAFYVPKALKERHGVEVVPVPVYYPEATEILGEKVYRSVAAVPGEVDIVDVFRKPSDVEKHVEEILAKKPRAVWLQTGIRNDAAAQRFAEAGIKVVQDR